jgi:hypothetical protein
MPAIGIPKLILLSNHEVKHLHEYAHMMDLHYSLAFSEFLVSYMLYSLALGNRPHVWVKKYDITLSNQNRPNSCHKSYTIRLL